MTDKIPFGKNLRADAAWILYQVLENGKSTRELLPLVLNRYASAKDKNWLNETVMGALRTLPSLQVWLRPKLKKPLKGTKKIIEHLLMVGLYQLVYMRVSDHAAVNETVAACKLLKADALKGLVNAILRDVQRHPPEMPSDPIIASGMPKWLYKQISRTYPEHASNIIENMNGIAPIWLRVNTSEIQFEDYCTLLQQADVAFETSEAVKHAVIVKGVNVPSLPGFDQGFFAVQDGAAQQAAWLLSPQDGESVLDCCAAPGGKTCHLYSLGVNANITAVDSSEKRLQRVHENLARLKAKATVVVGDASKPNEWCNGETFDKILVDAPCSATGVIRRHPDIRWLRNAKDIDTLVELQKTILDAIWPLLKPGGTLVYSTCSILARENVQQIDDFLSRTPDAQRNMEDMQILPGEQQMDGFYYARLLKSNGN